MFFSTMQPVDGGNVPGPRRRGRPKGSGSPIGPRPPGTPAGEPEGEVEPFKLAVPLRTWRAGIRRTAGDDLARARYVDDWLRLHRPGIA